MLDWTAEQWESAKDSIWSWVKRHVGEGGLPRRTTRMPWARMRPLASLLLPRAGRGVLASAEALKAFLRTPASIPHLMEPVIQAGNRAESLAIQGERTLAAHPLALFGYCPAALLDSLDGRRGQRRLRTTLLECALAGGMPGLPDPGGQLLEGFSPERLLLFYLLQHDPFFPEDIGLDFLQGHMQALEMPVMGPQNMDAVAALLSNPDYLRRPIRPDGTRSRATAAEALFRAVFVIGDSRSGLAPVILAHPGSWGVPVRWHQPASAMEIERWDPGGHRGARLPLAVALMLAMGSESENTEGDLENYRRLLEAGMEAWPESPDILKRRILSSREMSYLLAVDCGIDGRAWSEIAGRVMLRRSVAAAKRPDDGPEIFL